MLVGVVRNWLSHILRLLQLNWKVKVGCHLSVGHLNYDYVKISWSKSLGSHFSKLKNAEIAVRDRHNKNSQFFEYAGLGVISFK